MVIETPTRNGKPIYVYTNDMHDLKALVAKVRWTSSSKLSKVCNALKGFLNAVYKTSLFSHFLGCLSHASELKSKQEKVFNIFGSKLVSAAVQHW